MEKVMSYNTLETLADCCMALATERELGDELATALVNAAIMATATNISEKAFLNALTAIQRYEDQRNAWTL
jgi:hypothetical protein